MSQDVTDSTEDQKAARSTANEEVPPEEPVPAPKKSRFQTQRRQIRNWLYWLFPNWSAFQWDDVSYEKSHDVKENAKTRIPPELSLRVPIVWGCELYGPDEINYLYAGLQKLQWGISYRTGDKNGIEKWIKQQRAYGRQGSWLNGGSVVGRNKKRKYLSINNYALLPDGISSLHIEVFQLSPSLTGLLVGFRLDDKVACRYEVEINRERATYRKRIPRSSSISIIGPLNQKHDAVARVQSDLRGMVADWYKCHLPGYFSLQSLETVFPVLQLLSVKCGPILHEPPDRPREAGFGWRWLLCNSPASEVWTCQQNLAIQLNMSDGMEGGERGRLITAAVDESRFSEESMKIYGGEIYRFAHSRLPRRIAVNFTARGYASVFEGANAISEH